MKHIQDAKILAVFGHTVMHFQGVQYQGYEACVLGLTSTYPWLSTCRTGQERCSITERAGKSRSSSRAVSRVPWSCLANNYIPWHFYIGQSGHPYTSLL